MPAPPFDPLSSAPLPPANSTWAAGAAGPPSPFPWTDSNNPLDSATAAASPASTPLHTPTLSPSTSFSSNFDSPQQQLKTPPQQHTSTFVNSLSPASAFDIARRSGSGSKAATPAQSRSSSPAPGARQRDGLRTPSGFEFLDWGDAAGGARQEARSFDWEVYGPGSPYSFDLTAAPHQLYKRRLGPTEISYYLGSRGEGVESGVNDMYLHIGFKARGRLMSPERLLNIWTELTSRHGLLTATVEYENVNEVRFCYEPPKDAAAARATAKSLMETRVGQDPKELLDFYLNGARTLSDERLSYLVFSTPESSFLPADLDQEQEYDMHLFCTHFLGDGMALHTTANELFTLLADEPIEQGATSDNIEAVLARKEAEVSEIKEGGSEQEEDEPFQVENLAQAMESKLVTPEGWGRMAWAGARVEFNRTQAKLVGGQAFPRAKLGERRTLVPTISYDAATTKKALTACKSNGTTISHAIFALSNVAYIRSTPAGPGKGQRDERLPSMLYSALNLRPYLQPGGDWYHIAIGYYNIILPSFLPSTISPAEAFWYRASVVRKQTSDVVKSKWMASRAKLMALERERRAIGFEKEDERRRLEKRAEESGEGLGQALMGLGIGFGGEAPKVVALEVKKVEEKKKVVAPSTALMGLSMLGNLDGMYAHKNHHGLQLHTLTTGSRQRPGALLLFAYTFAGKLWLSLGYDSMGFQEGAIDKWWAEVQKGVDEFLLA